MSTQARSRTIARSLDPAKFRDPDVTAKGERRASVTLRRLDTLWFNTGTLCNIECAHCYIESSPRNDRLAYLSCDEVRAYLDEIADLGLPTREIGFTGGEPFLNPEMPAMAGEALGRGFEVLILTNAMQPMMRPAVREALLALRAAHGRRLTMRVSIDHYGAELHDGERGRGSFVKTLAGVRWLAENGFALGVAGRTCWGEDEPSLRAGYRRLFEAQRFDINADDARALVLFPEMDPEADVPEITVDCWGILGVDPADMMCATSRMVVKRKGAAAPAVLACTLLPYDPQFELGGSLQEALGSVKLNHPHCAKFCVLGGGSCSVTESASSGSTV
jgi:uncharacterized Fe-S cluster-containing radical SAM superfamily protein